MKHPNQNKRKFDSRLQPQEVVEFEAFMGNRSGTVKKDKKNNVYVLDQNGNVMVVKNLRNIPHVFKLPVIVGVDPSEPGIMQVLRQRNAYHNPPYPNVAEHAEIMHSRWGSDPVWVNKQQIIDLLPYPASTTGMIVQLRGGKYYLNGDHILANQTIDFSAEIPASGACWVLAEVDETKIITLRAGSTVASREVLTPEDIPAPATDQKRLFAVKCYYGQTRIQQTKTVEDIYILHDVPGEGGGGSGVSDHNALTGLQGGTTDEYYHLTETEHTELTGGAETTLHKHALADVNLPILGSPSTYLTARDDLTVRGSAGVIDGDYAFIVANAGAGTHHVNVGFGDGGYIRSTNDPQGDLIRVKWVGGTGLEVPNPATGAVTIRFYGVSYLSGAPQVVESASYNWNFNTTFPLGCATWDGTTLRILNEPAIAGDVESLTRQQLRNTHSFQRSNAPGEVNGLVISDVATRQLALTAGTLWRDLNNFSISAISAGTAFSTHYQRSGGGFNSTGGVTQWPNDKYDDGSGTLATIPAGKYACLWVYVDVADGALNVLYGRDEYDTVAEAQAEQEPTTAPNNIVYHGCLLGRIIFAASASSASVVESVWKHSQTYVEAGAYGLYQYGDGDDGDATLDGTNLYPWCKLTAANTYEMVRDAYLDNLTISSGVTLKMAYRIFGTATLTIDGTLDCKGGNASGATVGAVAPYGWYPIGATGGAGIASGGAAADGATSTGSNRVLGGWGGRGAGAWASALQRRGKNGFSSNNFPLPAVGGSKLIRKLDTALANFFANSTNTLIQYAAGQAGGGGAKSAVGTTCNSGGGGGGGGFLFVAFRYIVISASGVITADGGAGGNAGGTAASAGGGGGGGGGIVWLLYDTLTNAGSISAAGGAGGTSVALGTTPLKSVAAVVVQTLVLETSQAGNANCAQRLATAGTGVGAAKNTLYLVATNQNGGTLNDPVVTGWGLTWTKITGVDYKTIASPTSRLTLFYAYGTPSVNSDSYGANSSEILVTYSSAPTTANAVLYEIQNATGTIVQSATNRKDASGSGLTVTLGSAFGSTNAGAFGVFALDNWATRTAGSGFSIVSDYAGAGSMYIFGEMSYNDTTVDVAGSTNSAAGIAIEIQAVGAMESGTPGQDGAVVHFVNKG